MTDEPTVLTTALDLVVFAPLGLVLTVGEEIPKLAAKGRARLGGRITTARMVGQFAVTQGRREVIRRWGNTSPPTTARSTVASTPVNRPSAAPAPPPSAAPAPPPAAPAPPPSPASAPPPAAVPPSSAAAAPLTTSRRPSSTAATTPPAPTVSTSASSTTVTTPAAPNAFRAAGTKLAGGTTPAPVTAAGPDVASLAIPGYASLSASQVVQRLAGLSGAELEAVGAYEASNRGRRTILARVTQLQSS
jgi:hypothetical protein